MDLASGELRLRDTKTGARMVPLTPIINDVLASIPRAMDNPWVITGRKPGARLSCYAAPGAGEPSLYDRALARPSFELLLNVGV